jgi:hypothetical protein
MKSEEIRTMFEDISKKEKDLDNQINQMNRERREVVDSIRKNDVKEVSVVEGRQGGTIARASTGHIVLFSDPPDDMIGKSVFIVDYELRESQKTGNKYYKCFGYEKEKPVSDRKLENEKDKLDGKIKKLLDFRSYLWRIESELKNDFKFIRFKEIVENEGFTISEIKKIIDAVSIGLVNALRKLVPHFDRVIYGKRKVDYHYYHNALTLVKGDEILRVYDDNFYMDMYDDEPDFYSEKVFDSLNENEQPITEMLK